MKKLAIALFVLLGCVGNKPMPSQTANAGDDPRCKEFYEFVNKKWATNMEEFEEIKEQIKEELGIHIENPYDLVEVSFTEETFKKYITSCNKIIACNQKRYCTSFQYSNGDVWQFF